MDKNNQLGHIIYTKTQNFLLEFWCGRLWVAAHDFHMNLLFFVLFCFFFFSPLTMNHVKVVSLVTISVSLGSAFCVFPNGCVFLVSLIHCSRNPQVATTTIKLGPTALFTHLKIILLQCFQFLVFSNKRYPNRPVCF